MTVRDRMLGWEARLMVIITAALVVFGLVSVYGASSALMQRGRPIGSSLALDQALGAAAGGLLLIIASRFDLERLRRWAWPLMIGTFFALVRFCFPSPTRSRPA